MKRVPTMTKISYVPLIGVILFSLASVSPAIGQSTANSADDKSTADKAIVERLYDQIITGDLSRAGEFIAADLRDHNPLVPDLAPGLDGFKQGVMLLRKAFPDLHVTVGEILVQGEMVGVRVTMRGTHKGKFPGIPATGKQVKVEGIDLFRIENGAIVERWSTFDRKALMDGLGVTAPLGEEQQKSAPKALLKGEHKAQQKNSHKEPPLGSMREDSKGSRGAPKMKAVKNKPLNSPSEVPPSPSTPNPPDSDLRSRGGTDSQLKQTLGFNSHAAIGARLTDLNRLEPLREVFQNHIGQVRLIALLSPN